MNRILGKHLHKFVMCYLDDIMVYSKTPEEHYKCRAEVLQHGAAVAPSPLAG